MNAPIKSFDVSRRGLIMGAALIGGALVVGPTLADAQGLPDAGMGPFGPFIRISPDGVVTVVSKHLEMGQGNHVGLAVLAAEEMDADWATVQVVQAPADARYYKNLSLGIQGTGGSTAIANSYTQLRTAGAACRAMFVGAAAKKWGVPIAEVTVKDGVVSHAASGHAEPFGRLISEAALIPPPQKPVLKDPKTFTLVGTARTRRKDSRLKATGTAKYTQDIHAPGLLVAMVAHAPRFGGKVAAYDDADARKVPGVLDVVQIPTGVAVLALNTYAARRGRDALKVTWDDSAAEMRGTDRILADFKAAAAGQSATPGVPFANHGDPKGAFEGELFKTSYDFPYLSHAPMEPLNCSILIKDGKVKLTFGCQAQGWDQPAVGKVLGLPAERVEIETLFAGGSFGRRGSPSSDYVVECAEVARAAAARAPLKGRPVKLIWTREDDMTGGRYRPLVHHDLAIKTDAEGYPVAWRHVVVGQPIFPGGAFDGQTVEGVMGSPYLKATPVVDTLVYAPPCGVPVSFWRSVGCSHTGMVMEHTIDQLARRAGKDPVEYRRVLYKRAGADRHLAALDLAAVKAGWGTPLEAGWVRAVAVQEAFGTVVAEIGEVSIKDGEPRVRRVVCAVDCGVAVTPDQIAAQMEGGVCYGLSAALYGQITLTDGVVDQKNFNTYRVLRINEAPHVETHVVPSANAPTGVGEPGVPPIAPLVANALLQLNGKPISSLPIVKA